MTDIIQILPDPVANQIAAGEVIQRPASAVKELLENAIDSGADTINLIIKDAGKALIQVTDNGSGMSVTDARLCFERHATSKIRSADDLFCIRTMGFRGEALASIAAIAQVELKSKRPGEELGTRIEIEGSRVIIQEPCNSQPGTSISIRNLFFNVPARRNFLKSNTSETRHIIDEFHRIALAHPGVQFSLHNNGLELYRLPAGNLRQRIVSLFSNSYNERLVPVEEDTTVISIKGFIGKPEFARKTRGEQYFFVNNRYIRDPYLHHAVVNAYEGLLPPESFPSYFLFLDTDPTHIDINIHPTKTEIKFDDERTVYAIVRAAVKKSLGQYSVTPSLDFNQEVSIQIPHKFEGEFPKQPSVNINTDYNPFQQTGRKYEKPVVQGWENLYEGLRHEKSQSGELMTDPDPETEPNPTLIPDNVAESGRTLLQIHNRYIIAPVKSGFLVVDQQNAHERILYERFLASLEQKLSTSQQQLFPVTLELNVSDALLMKDLQNHFRILGFDIREFGGNTFVVHGIPAGYKGESPQEVIESIIEHYKSSMGEAKNDTIRCLAVSMAKSMGVKSGRTLTGTEMRTLIDELFACADPHHSTSGKPTLSMVRIDELERKFH
jgi:DNA mismatch repair protein MutL